MSDSQYDVTPIPVPTKWKAPPYPGVMLRLWGFFWCVVAIVIGTLWCLGRDLVRWCQNFDLYDTQEWVAEVLVHARMLVSKRAWVDFHWRNSVQCRANDMMPTNQRCAPPVVDDQP